MTLRAWACEQQDVRAVAVVGSYASGRYRVASDVDLLLLTSDPQRLDRGATLPLGPAQELYRRAWGVVVETRLRRRSGLQLDVAVGPVTWAAATPLDAGTARVLRDGVRVVHDPDGLLAGALLAATRGCTT